MEVPPEVAEHEAGVARLARFDADQVRSIESALARHLDVDATFVTPDGFSVTPAGDGRLLVHWRGAALIDAQTLNRIVREAVGEDDSGARRWREHLPEPSGTLAGPRRFKKRQRRKEAERPGDLDGR